MIISNSFLFELIVFPFPDIDRAWRIYDGFIYLTSRGFSLSNVRGSAFSLWRKPSTGSWGQDIDLWEDVKHDDMLTAWRRVHLGNGSCDQVCERVYMKKNTSLSAREEINSTHWGTSSPILNNIHAESTFSLQKPLQKTVGTSQVWQKRPDSAQNREINASWKVYLLSFI